MENVKQSTVLQIYKRQKNIVNKYLKDGLTTNLELSELGRILIGKEFRGVFFKDTIPELQPYESCILSVKTSKDNSITHWVGLIRDKHGMFIFYDPYGNTYEYYGFPKFGRLVRNSKSNSEQKITEENCGIITLAALLTYYRGGGMVFKYI